jgi:DtxR family Mn-dependent transcriptional regulator
MPHLEFLKQPTDELLEEIWSRGEEGDRTVAALLKGSAEVEARAILDRLVGEGLVQVDGERLSLSSAGEARAQAVVRSHRLTERLLVDVLGVSRQESDRTACLMEHVLSPAVTDAVCAFLGHPPTCPHGKPIPPGTCCTQRKNGVKPVVVPLMDLEPGASGRIVFMTPGVQKRLDRLASFGVLPGTVLELKQKRPSVVVVVGGTTLALEGDVAGEIYVRRES